MEKQQSLQSFLAEYGADNPEPPQWKDSTKKSDVKTANEQPQPESRQHSR
ncbi:MAG: hypothetical protein E6X17_14735 [Sporomusaceae bacterium]|nr:hypothetical protein [Sporomusaceae bacterium]